MSMEIDDQQHTEKSDNPATISVSARIEYILRFNQQVVLVIDDEEQGYLNAGSEFLDSLPENHNAAYLSMSNKFNDIQVRCRIIEQLFGDMPFDPETPLASCIINLLKDNNDHICILLDNAEHLSLQILHELCQLADIAKKSDRIINVVLLGAISAGKTVVNNPVLFKQKISIISGHSGQILSSTDAIFADKNRFFELTLAKKLFMLVLVLSLLASVIVYQLYQQDNFQFSALPVDTVDKPLVKQDEEVETVKSENKETIAMEEVSVANVGEIYSALLKKEETELAASHEIVNEIKETETLVIDDNAEVPVERAVLETNISVIDDSNNLQNDEIDTEYFKSAQTGEVIQFVAFPIGEQRKNIKAYHDFTSLYPQLHFNAYFRFINKQAYIVITSDIFSSKNEAKQKLGLLPKALKENGAWIKSLTAVKNEILVFERESQTTNQ